MPENPYEWSNEDLVGAFMDACADVGKTSSGLVMGAFADVNLGLANYLKGVVLARLEGEKPSFKPGDEVRVESGHGRVCPKYFQGPLFEDGDRQIVAKARYFGKKQWLLSFVGIRDDENNELFYPAEKFVLVS